METWTTLVCYSNKSLEFQLNRTQEKDPLNYQRNIEGYPDPKQNYVK